MIFNHGCTQMNADVERAKGGSLLTGDCAPIAGEAPDRMQAGSYLSDLFS
jgi:hypothetical protein